MKIVIAAIGKAKASPELDLYQSYIKRIPWKITQKEFDVKLADVAQRKQKEAQMLTDACQGYERLVALDESGRTLSSREFADTLGQWQQQGFSSVAFVIGGSDGLQPSLVKSAHVVWSFGRVTWPHMLVRPLLAEQLYRAHCLLTGHPYHRG
ncbi:MAG: 23S rRNA (pseudouridine(1915)-N(3))-methyltransferase RlmH [Rickettsiales bacterium]|nr:23S rRNA (pseudouridine(1915)-N(3))-methyltransferase RlmH [Rickettsiales bacterium]